VPRKTTNRQWIEQRLRYVGSHKKSSPGTIIRAIQLLGHLEGILPPPSPIRSLDDAEVEPTQSLSGNGLDDTVQAMLDRAEKAKNGGANGDKLPKS
jgi:hypothetical protein